LALLAQSLLAAALGAGTAAAGQGPGSAAPAPSDAWRTRREWALPGPPEGVRAADLDRDGRTDLLVALREPGRLLVWLGPAQRGWDAPLSQPIGDWPLPPVTLRVPQPDGKSFEAVALASRAARSLELLRVDATGGSLAALRTIALGDVPRALAGRAELLALVFDGGKLLWADADGVRREHGLAGRLPRCLALLDRGWLVAGCQDTQALEFVPPAGPARTLELGGIPRDLCELSGPRPLLAVAFGAGGVAIVELSSDGEPKVVEQFPCGPIPVDVEALSPISDGAIELLVLSQRGNRLDRFHSAGGPFEPRDGDYAGQAPLALAVGRFDADPLVDAVAISQASLSTGLFRGRAAGGFERPRSVPVGRFPREVSRAELDASAGDELVALCAKDGTLALVDFPRGAAQAPQRASFELGPNPRALACADFDGDGRDEIACCLQDGASSRLVLRSLDGAAALEDRLQGARVELGTDVIALLAAPVEAGPLLVSADATSGEIVAWTLEPGPGRAISVRASARFPLGSGPCALAWRGPGKLVAAARGSGPKRGLTWLELGPQGWREEGHLARPRSVVDVACDERGLYALETEVTNSFAGWLRCTPSSAPQSSASSDAGQAWSEFSTGLTPERVLRFEDQLLVACQDSHLVNVWEIALDSAGGRCLGRRRWDIGAGDGCMSLTAADLDGAGARVLVVANASSDDLSVIERAGP
jgi:hypothetical protein